MDSNDRVVAFLTDLRRRGVRIWTNNGSMHCRAPKAVLTDQDVDTLRRLKPDIIRLFESISPTAAARTPLNVRKSTDRAPLLPLQRQVWDFYEEGRHGVRIVYTATRLTGPLNIACLSRALQALVSRHESLRTRIILVDGEPTQQIDSAVPHYVETSVLTTTTAAARDHEIRHLIKQLIASSIDLSVGPLFEAKLIKVDADEHVLITVLDHIVGDGASANVLLQDLLLLYAKAVSGLPLNLPEMPVQFPDYALWQQRLEPHWRVEHAAYWRKRIESAPDVDIFDGRDGADTAEVTIGQRSILFSDELSSRLRALSRRQNTTLPMTMLSVCATLLFRWRGVTDLVIPFLTAGRRDPQIQHVIGLFSFPLLLRIEVRPDDSFGDILQRVTHEYDRASEHWDYGRIVAAMPLARYVKHLIFNWTPPDVGLAGTTQQAVWDGLRDKLRLQPFDVADPAEYINWKRATNPAIDFYDSGTRIMGNLSYMRHSAAPSEIDSFADNLLCLADACAAEPESRVGALDFPDQPKSHPKLRADVHPIAGSPSHSEDHSWQ